MVRNFIGIDPGASGGIASICENDHEVNVKAWPMPETEMDIWNLFHSAAPFASINTFALLERAQAFPGQGVSSCFNYGLGYGGLRMALIAQCLPFETVSSGVWQKALGCLSKGDKNVTKRKAQELFPGIKVTHKIADALLIAEFNRRTRNGKQG